jgi:S-adenosylmethionine:diacylglycerol 3-amino-3-carboxypropyl transferase
MKPLFDFGISQEDAASEETMLNLEQGDQLLCIASGGEVPLNLLCSGKSIKIDAIDISESQLALCRLKLLAALHIEAPANAAFLGYSQMERRSEVIFSIRFCSHCLLKQIMNFGSGIYRQLKLV